MRLKLIYVGNLPGFFGAALFASLVLRLSPLNLIEQRFLQLRRINIMVPTSGKHSVSEDEEVPE